MRAARFLLIVCLLLGLAAVAFAARAGLQDLRTSVVDQIRRETSLELERETVRVAGLISERMEAASPAAIYHADGTLKWPHPLWEARVFRPPVRSPSTILVGLGEFDAALAEAGTSAERAAVFLAKGVRERDAQALESALAEEALQGTDVALRTELERSRVRGRKPDAKWLDKVSALCGGPSDRFARALLAEAGLEPCDDLGRRSELADRRVQAGMTGAGRGEYYRFEEIENGDIELRTVPIYNIDGLAIEPEPGQASATLPEPHAFLVLVRDVSQVEVARRLRRQEVRLYLLYGGAGLVILLGTVYALVAMGRAERLTRAKSDFVANVTHELKTPLANIRLYAESLREGRVREADRAEFVGTILEESGRLDALIEGLLHAARGARLEMGPVEGARLLREAGERWRARLEREGFDLAVTTPESLPLRGDEEALRRALDNLIDNARKYSSDDRRIELTARADDRDARLTVRDHGPGIPVGERDRVLRPFHRLETADRKETAGTGLGLSLVVATMEAHGGRVEIGGGAGEGACVSLVLPVENKA